MPRNLEGPKPSQNIPVRFREWNPGGGGGEKRVPQENINQNINLKVMLSAIRGFVGSKAYTHIGVPL